MCLSISSGLSSVLVSACNFCPVPSFFLSFFFFYFPPFFLPVFFFPLYLSLPEETFLFVALFLAKLLFLVFPQLYLLVLRPQEVLRRAAESGASERRLNTVRFLDKWFGKEKENMSQQDGPQDDPERGESTGRPVLESSPRRASSKGHSDDLDEFGQLFKYVSTYREGGEDEQGDEEEVEKRVWYAPWKKRKLRKVGARPGQFPEEWRLTDIRQGLSSDEVTHRRRRSGWNELVSEKENPIVKIIGYFRGPILYGKQYSMVSCEDYMNFLTHSQ